MSKLIKIFLITLFSLAVSCSGGTTITGGDGDVYDNPDIEYGQFLPPKTSYTGNNSGAPSQQTTIEVVKNSDGTCNLKGNIVFTGPNDYNSSTKKWKEVSINVKVNDWTRTKGVTDSASARIDKSTLPADITYFGAIHYFKASYKLGSTTYPDTYHLDISVNGNSYAFQGKAN